jgi:2-oxoglutarate dehydrogenase E2 component (dihydrolipoamide succinyltransferase)
MIIEVKVPQLSESVSEATLLDWHKKEGEKVSRDENLIDIETDKVVLELPAPADGVLIKVIKKSRESVGSGDIIAQIDTEAKAGSAVQKEELKKETPQAKAPQAPAVMPAAQKIAAEKGIDTSKVQGSGRDGRVTKGDVLSQGEKRAPEVAKAPLQQPPPPINVDKLVSGRPEQRVPMSRLRQRVAERLVMAQHTAAILTTFNEVNMAPVMEMRKKYQERFEKEHGTRLGFMSFFIKAAVHALKRFPVVNASIDGTDIVYHGYFDIGVAVGSPRGLVVPILRDADRMSFAEIEKKIGDFGKRAQDGKLGIEELTGGTFSISNGGVFGSMLSTPILNPPQSAILGVHATKERAVVENGQVVVRPMNYLALSYDHRIIDGREAVLFLVSIKEALEDPARLILEI